MEYTTCMTMEKEAKAELRTELLKIHNIIPSLMKVLKEEDGTDSHLLWELDQNLCDLSNILVGDYDIRGLIIVLFNNSLHEAKGEIRELISVLKSYNMEEAEEVIKDALDNIEHLFVLYRG